MSKVNNDMIGKNSDPLNEKPQVYTLHEEMSKKVEFFLIAETQLNKAEGVREEATIIVFNSLKVSFHTILFNYKKKSKFSVLFLEFLCKSKIMSK